MRRKDASEHRRLARELDEIRLDHRWSFRELGERVGLPEPTIRKFVRFAGTRQVLETTVHPIRKYLAARRRSAREGRTHSQPQAGAVQQVAEAR